MERQKNYSGGDGSQRSRGGRVAAWAEGGGDYV